MLLTSWDLCSLQPDELRGQYRRIGAFIAYRLDQSDFLCKEAMKVKPECEHYDETTGYTIGVVRPNLKWHRIEVTGTPMIAGLATRYRV
jgi:hypothetical protein